MMEFIIGSMTVGAVVALGLIVLYIVVMGTRRW